ncbi:MAG: hypothetical protein GX220_01735 [Treponema sp.]|nr:hypothetical protein [Treponema sp.]
MENSQLILYVIKLFLGGLTAFFAITLWSKTRDLAWMCLVAGAVTSYTSIVYEMMVAFGIVNLESIELFNIPLSTLFFTIIPPVFYIAAFLIMIFRTRR